MLKVAVTVSKKKSNVFPLIPQLFLDPVHCHSSLCRKKSLEYPLKSQDCCPAPIAQKKDGEGEQMDSLSVCTVFHRGSPYHLCRQEVPKRHPPTRGFGSGGCLGATAWFEEGGTTGVSSECHKLQLVPTARISLSHIWKEQNMNVKCFLNLTCLLSCWKFAE